MRYRRWSALAPPEYSKFDALRFPGIDSPRVVCFDVETTIKTNPAERSRVVQFGCLEFDQLTHRVTERASFFIKLEHAVKDTGERIHHIPLRFLNDAKPFSYHAAKIRELMDGKVWAGHNIVAFDVPTLFSEFDDIGMERPKCMGIIDTMIVFSYMRYDQFTMNLKMETLGKHFGLGTEVHDAYEDSDMTYKVLMMASAAMVFSNLIIDPSSIPKISSGTNTLQQAPHPPGITSSTDEASGGTVPEAMLGSTDTCCERDEKKLVPLVDINGVPISVITQEGMRELAMRRASNINTSNTARIVPPHTNVLNLGNSLPLSNPEPVRSFMLCTICDNKVRMITKHDLIFVHCAYVRVDGVCQEYVLLPKSLDSRFVHCQDASNDGVGYTQSMVQQLKPFKPEMFIWCRPVLLKPTTQQ